MCVCETRSFKRITCLIFRDVNSSLSSVLLFFHQWLMNNGFQFLVVGLWFDLIISAAFYLLSVFLSRAYSVFFLLKSIPIYCLFEFSRSNHPKLCAFCCKHTHTNKHDFLFNALSCVNPCSFSSFYFENYIQSSMIFSVGVRKTLKLLK